MFNDDSIKRAYNQMLFQKADKQKREIDKKAFEYIKELERRSNVYKQQTIDDAKKQISVIDKNTENFKRQIREQAETHKRMIDDNIRQKQQSQTLSLDDVKSLFGILMKK